MQFSPFGSAGIIVHSTGLELRPSGFSEVIEIGPGIDFRVDLAKLREALSADNIQWERHVLERLISRSISRHAVRQILRSGECIEDYPDDYPFPSALFLGWHQDMPLHVVAALDEAVPEIHVITAYEPDLEHFEADFRTRRKN